MTTTITLQRDTIQTFLINRFCKKTNFKNLEELQRKSYTVITIKNNKIILNKKIFKWDNDILIIFFLEFCEYFSWILTQHGSSKKAKKIKIWEKTSFETKKFSKLQNFRARAARGSRSCLKKEIRQALFFASQSPTRSLYRFLTHLFLEI